MRCHRRRRKAHGVQPSRTSHLVINWLRCIPSGNDTRAPSPSTIQPEQPARGPQTGALVSWAHHHQQANSNAYIGFQRRLPTYCSHSPGTLLGDGELEPTPMPNAANASRPAMCSCCSTETHRSTVAHRRAIRTRGRSSIFVKSAVERFDSGVVGRLCHDA
jgi:hypothetical protein